VTSKRAMGIARVRTRTETWLHDEYVVSGFRVFNSDKCRRIRIKKDSCPASSIDI
jgi:hypothetical protein